MTKLCVCLPELMTRNRCEPAARESGIRISYSVSWTSTVGAVAAPATRVDGIDACGGVTGFIAVLFPGTAWGLRVVVDVCAGPFCDSSVRRSPGHAAIRIANARND